MHSFSPKRRLPSEPQQTLPANKLATINLNKNGNNEHYPHGETSALLHSLFCSLQVFRLTSREQTAALNLKFLINLLYPRDTSKLGESSGQMKNKRYILLVSAAAWMIIVWVPFNQRPSIAMLLSAIYCSVAAWLICLSIAGDYAARKRRLEEQETEERNRKIADAIKRAQMDTQNSAPQHNAPKNHNRTFGE